MIMKSGLFALALLVAVVPFAGAETVNRIVATIDGDPITLVELFG